VGHAAHWGPRAELIESPIMLVVVVLTARVVVRRHAELTNWMNWLSVGLFALTLMLLVEFTVVLWVRGLSLAQYFATRDPVSTTVYFVLLGVFAVLPVLVFQFWRSSWPHSANSSRAA
jgi:type IV secretory pathway TrbD component